MKKEIAQLKNRLLDISYIVEAIVLLYWDMEVIMPVKGTKLRADTISHLSVLAHKKLLDLDRGGILTKLKRQLDSKKLSPQEAVIVNETWRSYSREKKIPHH